MRDHAIVAKKYSHYLSIDPRDGFCVTLYVHCLRVTLGLNLSSLSS